DAAAVVVDENDGGVQPVQLGGQQAVQIMIERQVADDQDQRPVRPGRGAQGAGDDAVDAAGAPVAENPDAPVNDREEGVQVADRHAVADVQRRPVGQKLGQLLE